VSERDLIPSDRLNINELPAQPPAAGARRPQVSFKSVAAFCAGYTPLSYTVEGIVRSASLYTTTAKTGAGKTGLNVVLALAVVTGRENILGREVTKGRVAYLAFENPDDVRMRIMIACFLLNIDLREIGYRLVILDTRQKPEEILAELRRLAQTEPFTLVVVDTLAAFFDGKDINDNVQGGEFMRRLRPFTQIPGLPSVMVSAHPIKNASEDSLLPYGGGEKGAERDRAGRNRERRGELPRRGRTSFLAVNMGGDGKMGR
jgi:hypothetical protein